jgi:N-acyl-D-aspartate/D-glutamate deacylase
VEAHWDAVTTPWGGGSPYSLIARWALEGTVEEVRERLSRPEIREQARRWVNIPAVQSPQLKLLLSDEWDQLYLDHCRESPQYIGMNLAEIGAAQGKSPQDALYDLLIAEGEALAGIAFKTPLHTIEDDIRFNLAHPKCMPISDAPVSAPTGPTADKRAYYAYIWLARVLARYVRDEGLLSLPEAVRKLTSYPAWKLGLKDRGLLREGMKADIAIFDPAKVEPLMTRLGQNTLAAGFSHTIVNGQVAFEGGQATEARAGQVIRG